MESCSGKKMSKAMSPGSMTLPTMNNWDMGQSMSPYIPPDMNSKFDFELVIMKINLRLNNFSLFKYYVKFGVVPNPLKSKPTNDYGSGKC